MDADTNEAVLRRYVAAVYNAGDLAAISELVAPDLVIDNWTIAEPLRGPVGLKALIRRLRATFPDLRLEIEELSSQGMRIIARMTINGAYEPAQTGIAIFEIVDGKIVVDTAAEDLLGRLNRHHAETSH